jgi:hypothetical protein
MKVLVRSNETGPTGGFAFALQPPKYETNADGEQVLVSGNPLVSKIGTYGNNDIGIPLADANETMVARAQSRIPLAVKAIQEGQDVLNTLEAAIGPYSNTKMFAMNTIGALFPDSIGQLVNYSETARGQQQLKLFARTLISANALSDRFAFGEQQVLTALSQDPEEFFKDGLSATIQFQELIRNSYNQLALDRGMLGLEEDIYYLPSIPAGNESDPFPYDDRFIEYVNMLERENNIFDEVYFSLAVSQASAINPDTGEPFLPPSLYADKGPNEYVTLKYSNDRFTRDN